MVPVVAGVRGNPVLLDRAALSPALAGLSGDHGAGPPARGRDDVLELREAIRAALDVDTPDGLAALGAEAVSSARRPSPEPAQASARQRSEQ